jgi:phosphoenolpyruvate synthase/pyruvate phosphate dikinase
VFFTFLVNNDLFRLRLEVSKTGKLSWEEFAKLEQKFLVGKFPEEIMEQFRGMIDYYGQAPIIVRSSSLLEDGFTDAFAGKYRSEFCANQGSPENRLEAVLRAIKLVYASALNPDALAYRHRRGLGEGDEQMAVLVQRVSGTPYKQYFFPSLAGVAFSRNLYAWTNRIDPKKGMIRLVFGLGTRAVNRVSGDYPRMIAVSHPTIRPEIGMEIAKYSQRMVDLLNLEENTLETKPFVEVIEGNHYDGLNLLVSEMAEGYLRDWFVTSEGGAENNMVLTFNNLINRTMLVNIIGEILMKLEKAWEIGRASCRERV